MASSPNGAGLAADIEEEARAATIDAAWSTIMDGDMERTMTIAAFTEVLYSVLDFFAPWKETTRVKDLWKAVEAMRVAGASGGINYSGFTAYMTESERGVHAAALAAKREVERKERRASMGKEAPAAAAALAAAPAIKEIEVSTAILRYCAAQARDTAQAREQARAPRDDGPPGTQAFKIGALFRRLLPKGTAAAEQDDSLSVAPRAHSLPVGSRSRRCFYAFPDAAVPLACVEETAGDDPVAGDCKYTKNHVADGTPQTVAARAAAVDRSDRRGSLDAGRVHFGGLLEGATRGGAGAGGRSPGQLLWGGELDALVAKHIEAEAGLRMDAHIAAEDSRMPSSRTTAVSRFAASGTSNGRRSSLHTDDVALRPATAAGTVMRGRERRVSTGPSPQLPSPFAARTTAVSDEHVHAAASGAAAATALGGFTSAAALTAAAVASPAQRRSTAAARGWGAPAASSPRRAKRTSATALRPSRPPRRTAVCQR
ncbi:hypothetical protein FOA52_008413 [Chlamydomonas sp. UWO 241]|nr:hypothetical protein FOA52_008413 [Chlamydomonas sp. UWO 241]